MSNAPGNYPRLFPSPDQTIAGIGRALREGRTSCVEILNGCFAQVDEWEPKVHAWVVLDRERALEQAQGLDDELENDNDRGPLHGIPIGIKDIIDVAGLPTACGSKRWADKLPKSDADVVERLRNAGAVIMGKTVTTSYAWIDPPITRNPWNLERTPGGSSSGSAAAVACGMCYGAIGTQTGGSITRPASFCGLAGMMPQQKFVSSQGVSPFAPSLDHVGPIARTVDDLRLLYREIRLYPSGEEMRSMGPGPLDSPPRLGRLRGYFDHRVDKLVASELDDAIQLLTAKGAEIVELADPVDFERILIDHRCVMAVEAADIHSDWIDEFPGDYPPRIKDLIREGRCLTSVEYSQAKARMSIAKDALLTSWRKMELEFWITPASVTTAPDPSTTGDPAFNSPWSYSDLPTVSFPIGLARNGLPVGLQLIGSVTRQEVLLRAAQWCEQAIRTCRQ
jgi:Asp-tRNA(Asn)/Glu-tRNA(Gln) amidotransferase A subunit family amidase